MHLRAAIPAILGAAAMLATAGAVTAQAKTDRSVVLANYYTMADRAVDPMSESIRAILINAGDQGAFLEKKDVGALTAFYREQSYAPSWILNGKLTDRAKAVIARIKQADTDGLDPSDYPVPDVKIGEATPATTEALAHAEVLLSQAIIDYVHDAHSGRVDPADISQNLDYKPHIADPVEALTKISMADDAPAVLASYNPHHPEYVALRKKLAEIRASAHDLPPVIPPGPNLKLGSKDPRVAILRKRLKIPPPAEPPAPKPADTTPTAGAAAPAATTTDAAAAATDAAPAAGTAAAATDALPPPPTLQQRRSSRQRLRPQTFHRPLTQPPWPRQPPMRPRPHLPPAQTAKRRPRRTRPSRSTRKSSTTACSPPSRRFRNPPD